MFIALLGSGDAGTRGDADSCTGAASRRGPHRNTGEEDRDEGASRQSELERFGSTDMHERGAHNHVRDDTPQGSEDRERDRVGQDVEICHRHGRLVWVQGMPWVRGESPNRRLSTYCTKL